MKLQLNFNKPDNYAFFCPVSRVHLTRSNPVAEVNEVTPYIKRGLRSKAIIEVTDNTTKQEPIKEDEPKKQEIKQDVEMQPMPEQEESTSSVEDKEEAVSEEEVKTEEETKEEAPAPKKRGRKGSK